VLHHEEVAHLTVERLRRRRLAVSNGMGGADDHRLGGLTEDVREPRHRHAAGVDQVGERLARPDRRQLIRVADHHHARLRVDRVEEHLRHLEAEHAGLVDHEQVALEREARAAQRSLLWEPLEQAVDGRGRVAGRLLEPPGGSARRGAERHGELGAARERRDRLDEGRLARAGTAGHHREPPLEGGHDRLALLVGQVLDSAAEPAGRLRRSARGKRAKVVGEGCLGSPRHGQRYAIVLDDHRLGRGHVA
jgi:hypothetical protein